MSRDRFLAEELERAVPRDMPENPSELLLDAIRVVDIAEQIFYRDGEPSSPDGVLREALQCAAEDFELLGPSRGSEKPEWAFYRAERRIELALVISTFRRKHGGDAEAASRARALAEEADDATEGVP